MPPVRVLLVEDNGPLRELNRILLTRSGRFEVVGEAENGLEAIQLAAALRPEVILLDLLMPVMSGFDALPRIRSACPDALIIALSMLTREVAEERALAMGADHFLDKGTPDEGLADAVAELLRPGRPSMPTPVPPAPPRVV